NLSGYNGAIRWVPIDSSAKGRVVVEKIARGSLRIALDKFLGEIEVENLSSASQLVLKANKPRRIWGVSASEVRFTVYVSPEQIQEFQAQISNGAIKVDADFFGLLNLKTSNGSITLHSAAG